MGKHLKPGFKSDEQRRLVLGGAGGIGKTQLAIAYAKMHHTHYDSVFWLDARSEASVNASLRSIAELAFELHAPDKLKHEEALIRTRQWLSDSKNTQWLLIFDNYDDPEQFVVETYFPHASHGAIIITTRRPDLTGGTYLRVQPLKSIKEGLFILQSRSNRQGVTDDPHAKRLAERFAGHPLALATAGAFLHYSTLTFERYLQEYERRWAIDPRRQYRLKEYGDRTLYTTWDLSYSRLEEEDSDAARLLTLLAYFDNQSLEYKLFHAGLTDTAPEGLHRVISDDLNFNNAMATLTRYCFLDIHQTLGYWSMQNCVHDWTLAVLNQDIRPEYYSYATNCVVVTITGIDEHSLRNAAYAPLAGHAQWLVQQRFLENASILAHAPHSFHQISCLSGLLYKQDRFIAAERAYVWALARYGQTLQVHGVSLLQTMHNLASVYHSQGKLHEAEDLYGKVLLIKLDVLGEDNESTLHTLHNLGALNHQMGRAPVAMEILQRALTGREKVLGESAISTLDTVNAIGDVNHDLGRLKEAESMYRRALDGQIQVLGAKHPSTLSTLRDLAGLSTDMGAFDDSEKLHKVALIAYSEVVGEEHPSILNVFNSLGNLYKAQGKFGDAERMYHLALAGLREALGPNHISCLHILGNLGNLYGQLAKFDDAERMHTKALVGFRQAVGEHSLSTINTYSALGEVYLGQRNAVKAEEMYLRALDGYTRTRGADNPSTLSIALKLGAIYGELEMTSQAETFLLQARDGFERTLGDDHFLTLNAVFNLGHVYTEQHRLDEAETMYTRAFYGYERMFGKSHTYTADTATYLLELYTQQGRLNDAKRISLRQSRGKDDAERSGDSSGSITEPAFAPPGLRML
ncbi:uncharacterized protein LDX57_010084 [Aspergillus melleus]|uniref:uncharacterized protein n=1 Tax=Aspergillus melleus TaxID=138277 RepID=UPI001E8D3FE7|nr:uncharacterized protein LDX57_010084 [Aspergillus melleus]KAH8432448.1 hypothetical protein LDX57_010084 [Aspergillus melleus]